MYSVHTVRQVPFFSSQNFPAPKATLSLHITNSSPFQTSQTQHVQESVITGHDSVTFSANQQVKKSDQPTDCKIKKNDPLTARELEVLRLAAHGNSNAEIAAQLYISVPTVKTHLVRINIKLGVKNRTEMLATAKALGLIPKPEKAATTGDTPQLTPKELEVATLLAQGLTNLQICEALDIAMTTVKHHVEHLCAKLGVRNRTEAVEALLEQGLVSLEEQTE